MIFDTHCHLNSEELYSNIDDYILRAKQAGVGYFLVVGYDLKSSKTAIEIAYKYDCCFAAVGLHPTEVFKDNINLDEFETLLNHPKVVALGEIGLDYHWVKDNVSREIEKEYFIAQIDMANSHKLPILVHCRDAINDCYTILNENKPLYGGVMHCYSGPLELCQQFNNLGLYISLGGPVTFKNAKTPKEIAEFCDLNYLLVETDSPYLAPHPYRGTINEPKNIALVVDEIANLRKMSKKTLIEITTNNAKKLFKI